MLKNEIRKKNLLWFSIFFIMLIASFFQIKYLQFIDELLCVFCIICIFNTVLCKKYEKNFFTILKYLFALFFIGIGSNLVFKLQYNYLYVIEDIFLFFKPFIIFLGVYNTYDNINDIDDMLCKIEKLAKLITIILIICLFYAEIFKDTNMGAYSSWVPFPKVMYYTFFAEYPAFLGVCVGALIMILLLKKSNGNKYYIILNCIVLAFTQSGTSYIILLLTFTFMFVKKFKKLRWYHILFLIIIGSMVGINEIKEYLLNSAAARNILFSYALITAKKYFPLGSGFSTYGGTVAGKYYSKLYYDYGFNNVWGLAKDGEVNFLYDTYYPMIIGEVGWIGTIVYIRMMMYLFGKFNNVNNYSLRKILMFGFITLLVIGMGQGGITSILGAIYMVLLALVYRKSELGECR